MDSTRISLQILIRRFWKKVLPTWMMVILEGIALISLPLVIGWAVDDLINKQTAGLLQLGVLCLLLLVIGAGRRFYDTRAYAGIYRTVTRELILRERENGTCLSKISARTHLFSEFIEFLEDSLPDIFNQFIGVVGTLCIIAWIDINTFVACLVGSGLTWLIFFLSQNRIFAMNRGQNDELEKQVEIIAQQAGPSSNGHHAPNRLEKHLKTLMGWNIKLSDLETLNFSMTWIVLAGVLIYSVVAVSSSGASPGRVVSAVMYVFGFIESVMTFPLYYQQVIRLEEIAGRLG